MGYIKLDRKTLEWEWFTDVSTSHLWVYILLKANHKPKVWRDITIEKGSFVTSEAKMVAETGLSREQVRRALKNLISSGQITKTATNAYTLISVIKWALYQGSAENATNETTNEPTYEHTNESTNEPTTTKNIKNLRSKEDIYNVAPSRPKKPFVKPTLEEVKAYCIENGYDSLDAERFINYYDKNDWTVKDKGGRKKMSNWKLCLNSWVVNEIRYNQTSELRNQARLAYIKDVEMKAERQKKGDEIYYEPE